MNRMLSAALALALMSGAAAAETIRVGMSGGYFPFTFTQGGQLQGFEVDVMNEVGKRTGDQVEFVTMGFAGLIGAMESGRIDTIANQITITPEREERFLFSRPYVYDGAQVVTQRGNDEVTGIDSLAGKTVAVDLGTNYEQILREHPEADQITIRTYEGNVAQETALGRVDAFVMDRVSSAQLIKESGLPLQLAGPPFSEIRNALPFRNDEAGRAMRDRVDAALEVMGEDGTLSAISEKWLDIDVTKPAAE
ncbi:amino acid ABC transporter substrate-binding protein [Paracoccus sp. (in: a-proteobacteria)]|uniref:amino acid ABC transporter substrate-binding protein n=1 Tax=Paracoccus sp. TaxID=267 RepID=UPI0026DF9FAB|nr:amino acid ABC transporter substrate-binding protein [Paracoccus sp. (in: a-proteobacteria)]MDO5370646.1 amino acid ABC transporter substrate-binding protein [Paracoccus sp. (in: a-proteobacteria)]